MTISCRTCDVYRLLPALPEMSCQDTEQQFDMITALLGMCVCNVMIIVYTHGDIAIKLALSVQLRIVTERMYSKYVALLNCVHISELKRSSALLVYIYPNNSFLLHMYRCWCSPHCGTDSPES